MKSLEDIQSEFFDQLKQKDAEPLAKVRQAREEKDAVLQRAGIKDGPDYDGFADDADRWRDDDHYRCRVRELVFGVPDVELRREIMRALSSYRYELYDRSEMRHLFMEGFADRLRGERCHLPRLPGSASLIALPLALLGIAYWFRGPLDALVVGVGVLLPSLAVLVIGQIAFLLQRDVIFREAIKMVERNVAVSKQEATRRLHLPEIFSRREMRTGEVDEEIGALSG